MFYELKSETPRVCEDSKFQAFIGILFILGVC